MSVHELGELTFREVATLDRERTVAVLPLGAVEAHGPHLPLVTDGIIAGAMAREGARRLAAGDWTVVLLPAIHYTAAPFAAGFPGTVSVPPEVFTEGMVAVGTALARLGPRRLAVANAHLDPTHLGAVHAAVGRLTAAGLSVAFPDLTRRPWASRLSDEFKSGACHAGRYEGSVVLSERPELVREEIQRRLVANPVSLSTAIATGATTFEEIGGTEAYFGDPAAATAAEGRQTVEVLGAILAEATLAMLDS